MIPKIIHQTWKDEIIPDKWKNYHDTWKKHFPIPEYKHILWTDKDNREFIKENYNWFLEIFDNYPKNIQRADAVRYFILYHYGGIYADLDCEVRENFYQYLDHQKINLAQSPYSENGLMNNLMASPEKTEIWYSVFETLKKNKNILSTLDSTGPHILRDTFSDRNLIKELDYNYFNPLKKRPYFYGLVENAFFTKLDNEKAKNWDNAYVVHHGSESWRKEEIITWLKNYKIFILLMLSFIIIFLYKKYYV